MKDRLEEKTGTELSTSRYKKVLPEGDWIKWITNKDIIEMQINQPKPPKMMQLILPNCQYRQAAIFYLVNRKCIKSKYLVYVSNIQAGI